MISMNAECQRSSPARVALQIQYNGSRYHGWERKKDVSTVQSCVEAALTDVYGHPVNVQAASRTDAGAHALGQVVHFDTDRPSSSDT